MSLSADEVKATLRDGFNESLKARFATIATNELTGGKDEAARQFELTMRNLKEAYDLACDIASKVFASK